MMHRRICLTDDPDSSGMNGEDMGILFATIAFAIMVFIGMRILTRIDNFKTDKRAEIRKALEINSDEQFFYGMRTNAGKALVYGTLCAVDPVKVFWAPGDLMIWKVEVKKRTKHVQVNEGVDIDVNGHRRPYRNETVYYTWDTVSTEIGHANEVTFRGELYPFEKISFTALNPYGSVNTGIEMMEERYALPAKMTGTLYTTLGDNTISYGSQFMPGTEPSRAREGMIQGQKLFGCLFYAMWIPLTLFVMFMAFLFGSISF